MNKKFTVLALATLVATGGVLAGCSPSEEPEKEPVQNEQQQAKEDNKENVVAIEETATAQQVQAYQTVLAELNNAKEDKAVDWDKITSEYEKTLQGNVQEINSEFDTAIVAAIEAGKTEQLDANVARQLVDKTTQSYFYQKQKSLHSDVIKAMEEGNNDNAKVAFEEINYLAEQVLIPTATKRDTYYETDMVTQIENGLALQEKALNDGNVDDYSVYKQITDKSVYRSYYLAANSYAEKVAKAVKEGNTDVTELRIMQAEGWGFYQAIKGSLSGGNEEAANTLEQIFNLQVTDPTEINADEVTNLFTKAFLGKIKSYHEKAPKALEDGNLTKAKGSALEGNIFMKAIQLDLYEELGEEKAQEAFDNAEKWFDAIANENKEEASTYSANVIEILNEVK